MSISEFAKKYHEKMFPNSVSKLKETDPEFIELFDNFAFDEVINEIPCEKEENKVDDHTRMIAILSALLGCQGIDEFKVMLEASLNFGVTPIEIKEIVYQSVAYLGIGRVLPFLCAVNDLLIKKNIKLPLNGQAVTTKETRLEKGIQSQVDIFGDGMKEFYQSGPDESKHINKWLAANCFGDYYTRNGLSYKERELITFCFLVSQGGCESQLISHITANIQIGNGKQFLINILSQCIPFIGYPRSLNGLRCISEAVKLTNS